MRAESIHVIDHVTMSPMRLQAFATQPARILAEQPLRGHNFNFAEVFDLEVGGELILPQRFIGQHAVVVLAGLVQMQTHARGGVCESRLHVGQVVFAPISHARLPTRSVVSASDGRARILLAALNPAQFC
jgi:hypothetical protein